MKQTHRTYVLKTYKDGEMVQRTDSRKMGRISRQTRLINWQNVDKAHLHVNYGYYKDNFGKLSKFYNDGYYENAEELELAWQAFIE